MQNSIKTSTLLRYAFIFLLCGSLVTACKESEEKKSMETTTMEVKDSIPALDTDSNTTVRPETLPNGSAPTPAGN